MKKIIVISGIIAFVLLTFLLTGAADTDDTVKKALRQGNQKYEEMGYKEALELYETGLAASPEHKALNFNAGQAAYLLGEYEKAVEYYGKSEDCIEKFLNAGNIFFRVGEAIEDESQKAQYYMQAVQMYHEGITKFPQDVPLKYNYEIAKEKAEEFLEDSEQEEQGEQERSESESSEGESGDSQENQESQEQESEESQSEGEEQENGDENEEQQESYTQEDSEDGEESGEENSEEDETDLDQEAIERILQMLESQEEESLKNNQEMISGGDEKNGW